MQAMPLCILSGRQFEDTFENSQWRKAKQMQPVQICFLNFKQFEETFEKTQWRKIDQADTFQRTWGRAGKVTLTAFV